MSEIDPNLEAALDGEVAFAKLVIDRLLAKMATKSGATLTWHLAREWNYDYPHFVEYELLLPNEDRVTVRREEQRKEPRMDILRIQHPVQILHEGKLLLRYVDIGRCTSNDCEKNLDALFTAVERNIPMQHRHWRRGFVADLGGL